MAQIEVRNASGSLLAILTPEDGVKDAYLSRRLNGDCELNFSLPATSEKLQYLTSENLIYCDNRVFVLADPDSVMHVRRDGELWANVQARERWVLLDRVHKTVCNDDNAKPVNDLDVVITKTGAAAGGYAAGSAGSALSHLLAGTGWGIKDINLLTPNQASVETDLTGLAVVGNQGSKGTLSRITTDKWHGTACAQVVVSGYVAGDDINLTTADPGESTDTAVFPNTIYAFSFYFKAPSAQKVRLRVIEWTSGGAVAGDTILTGEITGNGDWQRVAGVKITGSTTAYVSMRAMLVGDGTYLFDGLQIEQNSYASPWQLSGEYWPTGQHEIKTSQESILANIKKVQELWGGYLIWNSADKGVILKSESWQPYSGYAIHLGKNLKGVTRSYDYDVVTKLWVFGQNDVDIFDVNVVHSGTAQGGGSNTITLAAGAASVNGAYIDGVIYITGGTGAGQSRRIIDYNGSTKIATVESNWATVPDSTSTYEIKARFLLNFGYTNELRSSVWRNQDIIDPSELKAKGQEVHTKLAYPRVHYKVEHVDLRTLTSHAHETFAVGDMVDVIDEELGIAVQVRVIYHRYNVFQPWLCDIELGDESYELKQILAELKKQSRVTYRLGRAPSTIIIASEGTTKNTRRADFIIPRGATNADAIIAKAASLLPLSGGKITLLEGTFVIQNPIKANNSFSLEGQGAGTIIKVKDGVAQGNPITFKIIQNSDQSGGNFSTQISDLVIDGNKANNGNTMIYGLHMVKVTSLTLRGVEIKNCLGAGAHIESCPGFHMSGLIFRICGYPTVGQGAGLYVYNCAGIFIGNCYCQNNALYGLKMLSCDNVTVDGGVFSENGYDGIMMDSLTRANLKVVNAIKNGRRGLCLFACSSCTITGGTVNSNSQEADNTYDNVFIDYNSDYNNIQLLTCRKGNLANRPRYGIRINSSDCNGNIITNCDLYDSGVSGSLSDAGTGTITTAGNRL